MVSSVNGSLLSSYLASQAADSTKTPAAPIKVTNTTSTSKTAAFGVSQAALNRAASTASATSAAQALETAQKKLGTDMRAAMEKAGVKLTSAVDFSVKSDGSVSVNGTAADKAAVQDFLKADTSQPSFASRIANQAKDALKLSSNIQQSAAISQAAKSAKSAAGVMSLYTSLMQQTGATNVVFSLTPTSSSLSYPGSLTANA